MPTVLLVHCDGTNGSTTFTDRSLSAHTLTPIVGAAVTTTQAKFGTGAANTSGALNAGIQVTGTLADFDFQSGPFTIECWAWLTGATSVSSLFSQFNNASGGGFFFGAVSGLYAFWYYNGAGTQVQYGTGASFPATGAWHHYCADRDAGGTLRLYIDGVVQGSTSAPTFQTAAVQANIGNANSTGYGWPGYIDEVRVTKGTAVYAGAFTPPTGPFADPATNAQVTQAALEQWFMPNADARTTQIALEMWGPGGSTTPRAVVTQASLEMWGVIATQAAQARCMVLA